MKYKSISIRRAGGISEIRFETDGGPLRWNPDAHREAGYAFAEVAGDTETKVVIITGTGDAWCTEVDAADWEPGEMSWDRIWWEGKRLITNLLNIDVPVIGAVNGPAFIHAEIPLLADFVIAADTAAVADRAHMPYGTIPGDGVHLVWPYLIGPRRAKAFLLFSEELSPQEAFELGVFNELVPPDQVGQRAWEIAEQLSQKPLLWLRYLRETLNMHERPRMLNGLSHGLVLEGAAAPWELPSEAERSGIDE